MDRADPCQEGTWKLWKQQSAPTWGSELLLTDWRTSAASWSILALMRLSEPRSKAAHSRTWAGQGLTRLVDPCSLP